MSLRLYRTNLDSLVDNMLSDAFFSSFRPARVSLLSDSTTTVKDSEDGTTIAVEVPGVAQSDLEVAFHEGLLTISGKSRTGKSYRYSRSIDAESNDSEITATLSDGILEVFVPRAKKQSSQPRRININSCS